MRYKLLIAAILLIFPSAVYGDDYIIGEGDTLYVSVWGEKDLSVSVKVRPDGKITIPALGDVSAAGFTTAGLQTILTGRLKHIVRKPVVTVTVEDITNNKVYIFGGGVDSGIHNLTRRTTLLQLLCQIGNVGGSDLKNAYVLRDGKKVKNDFHKLFIEGDVSEDIAVVPNDVIFIPGLADKNIYVFGAVNEPRYIAYRNGMTVMEAILEAGGFTKFAKLNGIVIYRKNGKEEISIPVKAKRIIKDGKLEQNVALKPGDYIVVRETIF